MAKFDADLAGLTILDVARPPVTAVPEGGGVAFIQIESIRREPRRLAALNNYLNQTNKKIGRVICLNISEEETGEKV